MQLEHSFSVPAGIDEAWRILIDIERIVPCMPGAAVESVDGDEFTGTVKVKLGPINLTYKGKAAFLEKDEAARRAVIDARGRDARGNGTAAARITATLHESGDSTTVQVFTDLDITGKPAQFGRGVMVDVGNKLLGQFADSLARTIKGGEAETAPAAAAPAASAPVPAADETPATTEAPGAPAAGDTAVDDTAVVDEPVARSADTAGRPTGPAEQRTPAYSVSGGRVPTGEAAESDGRIPPSASKPEHELESVDLLHSAGPAVAKRLAPVAVALVVVLIAIRRRNARRG